MIANSRSPSPVYSFPQPSSHEEDAQHSEPPPKHVQVPLGSLWSVHDLRWSLWWLAGVSVVCFFVFLAAILAIDPSGHSMIVVPGAYELAECALVVSAALVSLLLLRTPIRPIGNIVAFFLIMSLLLLLLSLSPLASFSFFTTCVHVACEQLLYLLASSP